MYENIAKSKAERANLKIQSEHLKNLIEVTKSEAAMKKIQERLMADGIYPNDPWYFRKLVEVANNLEPVNSKSGKGVGSAPTR